LRSRLATLEVVTGVLSMLVKGRQRDWCTRMGFAQLLRALMEERGLSGNALARKVHCDPGYISRLASGKQRPSRNIALLLDDALGAGGKLAALARPAVSAPVLPLGLLFGLGLPHVMPAVPGPGDSEGGDRVERRAFNTAAMGMLAGMLLPPRATPAAVSHDHVCELRSAADALWTRDWTVGGSVLLGEAIRTYTSARAILDHSSYTAVVGRELQAVSADLAACAGFVAFDAGVQPLARSLLSESALLAGSTGDPVLSAHAYALLALQSTALAMLSGQKGPAREALRFLDQAGDLARHEPSPRLHATIWMRRATASAVLGDDVEVRRTITTARRELDRGNHPADPHWAGFVTPSEITAHEATARLGQGKPGTAARLFRDVLADDSLPPRNRALYQARLATALLAADDRTEAFSEGMKAVTALEGPIKSARTLQQLHQVRQAAAPGSEFASRLDAVASQS
jgi:Helix-turn-helix domain